MKRWLLLLLLGGCLKYEISIETVVRADGTCARVLSFLEKDDQETWRRLRPPGATYTVAGSDEEGITARAELKAGANPSGLRVLLENAKGEYGGADAVKDFPFAEGTVFVDRSDLVIGTLYTYRETVETAADPVYFRKAVPHWLDVGFRLLMETLRVKEPGIDFAKVEANARKEILPRAEQALVTIHQALGVLLRDYREHRYSMRAATWLEHPQVRLLLLELKGLGVVRKKVLPQPKTLSEAMDDDQWELGTKLVDEFLAPLEDRRARERIKEMLLDPDDHLGAAFEEAAAKIFPAGEREKSEEAMQRFVIAGIGAYTLYGIFDSFHMRFRVKMPGRVLRTNGDLGRYPQVTWDLHDEELFLVSPQLTVHSFVPAKGVERGAWSFAALAKVRDRLAEFDPREREMLDAVVFQARRTGWTADGKAIEREHGENVAEAYEAMKAAIEDAGATEAKGGDEN